MVLAGDYPPDSVLEDLKSTEAPSSGDYVLTESERETRNSKRALDAIGLIPGMPGLSMQGYTKRWEDARRSEEDLGNQERLRVQKERYESGLKLQADWKIAHPIRSLLQRLTGVLAISGGLTTLTLSVSPLLKSQPTNGNDYIPAILAGIGTVIVSCAYALFWRSKDDEVFRQKFG